MKIMFNVLVLLGALVSVVVSQNSYDSEHLIQDSHYDSDEVSYHPNSRRHQQLRSYESPSHDDVPSSDPRHYQSLEPRYHKREQESYARQPQYHAAPQHVQYHQPEDPSYHRPQEIVYHQSPQHVQHHQQEDQSSHRPQEIVYHQSPQHVQHHQPEDQSSHRPQEIVYHQSPQHYQAVSPQHEESYQGSSHYLEPERKEDDSKYATEEPKYTQTPRRSSHPAPLPTDPKLPLYFTMYEKRVVQDPLDKYGKGPWRYLTYGHGITYGSKEPGKVFEKGYGYIRALGRDHCKLPEHLCPARDEKPFDYEGRKEPYFGYRPH